MPRQLPYKMSGVCPLDAVCFVNMNIVQLHANAPFAVRVGFNDHLAMLAALAGQECEGARVPVDMLVFEAHWQDRHAELVKEASVGRQVMIDYRVDQWTIPGVSSLPAEHKEAYSAGEIFDKASEIASAALEAQRNATWALAPSCHIDAFGDAGWTSTVELLDATIRAAGRPPMARLIGTPSGLATPRAAETIAQALGDRDVRRLVLTVGPVATDQEALDYLQLVRYLSKNGVAVHATHQGALGLAALAMGAASFDAGMLGKNESFDHELQRARQENGSFARMPKPRGYAGPLLVSVWREVLSQLFQLKPVRASLECDGPCCASRMDGAVLYPVTHWSYQRAAQVRAILSLPVELRGGQVTEMYAQALTLFDTIRSVSRSGRSGLPSADLATLSERMADVRAANRRLAQALQSESWAASF